MFVKQRGGDFKVVLGDILSSDSWSELSNYSEDMRIEDLPQFDIVAAYERSRGGCMTSYLEGHLLTLVWERTEQTEAQKEMEVLQEQAKALQEQITKLQGKL